MKQAFQSGEDACKCGFDEFLETGMKEPGLYTGCQAREICLTGVMTEVSKGVRILRKEPEETVPDHDDLVIPGEDRIPGYGSGPTVKMK